jgi:FkbM family methyltransferase
MKIQRRATWWRRLARRGGGRLFRLAENNDETRFDHNGERWLLHAVLAAHVRERRCEPAVIMDVGANTGDYTRAVLELATAVGAEVDAHLFEPSPQCQARLRAAFGDVRATHLVASAVGEVAGEATLHHGRSGSSHASLLARPDLVRVPESDVRVPVLRLDDYVAQKALGRIALLKLDVEGFELSALRGLGERLRPAEIDVIQFEYGGTTRDAGVTLRELAAQVQEHGFVFGKLLPGAVEVRNYAPWMENFAYANYVALAPRWLGVGG